MKKGGFMRILHITDRMHAGSGISQLLLSYSKKLVNEGIYFDYLVERCDDSVKDIISLLGGEVYIMPKLGFRTIKDFCCFLRDFFRKCEFKIVHSHYYQIDIFAMHYAYKSGVSHYISHSHNPSYSDYALRSIRNWILSLPIRVMATDFCACSQESGEFLFGKHLLRLRGKKLYVLPNAIDYSKFYFNKQLRTDVRERFNIKEELVIGIVGSLRPQKNQGFLVKVFKFIHDNYDQNVRLIMVGDGVSRCNLENLIGNNGLVDNVIITGFTDRSWEYYNAFDCYVLPSVYEGFGLSLLEAQVNSLRCVCSSVIPDDPIISNHVIKLHLTDNIETWAKTIYDSAIQGRYSEVFSDSYNVESQSEKLTTYYKNMIK